MKEKPPPNANLAVVLFLAEPTVADDFRIYDIERVWMVRESLQRIDTLSPVRSVLDCACNIGYWMAAAERWHPGARMAGIDNDVSNISKARESYPNFELIHGDSREVLKDSTEQFDAVLCMGVLYYYFDFEGFLKAMSEHCGTGMLVDTFCVRDETNAPARVVEINNPDGRFTRAAAETKPSVRIPNVSALCETMRELGFFAQRIDRYSGPYDQSVGARLGHELMRVGVLGVRLENERTEDRSWSGWLRRG